MILLKFNPSNISNLRVQPLILFCWLDPHRIPNLKWNPYYHHHHCSYSYSSYYSYYTSYYYYCSTTGFVYIKLSSGICAAHLRVPSIWCRRRRCGPWRWPRSDTQLPLRGFVENWRSFIAVWFLNRLCQTQIGIYWRISIIWNVETYVAIVFLWFRREVAVNCWYLGIADGGQPPLGAWIPHSQDRCQCLHRCPSSRLATCN